MIEKINKTDDDRIEIITSIIVNFDEEIDRLKRIYGDELSVDDVINLTRETLEDLKWQVTTPKKYL